jgi:GT2 family glycosyltransferase
MAYLEACLASVWRELGADDQVIVVDDASNDGSAAWVKEHWPAVIVVECTQNVGFAAACDRGVAASAGETLAFLNQDTSVLPGWLDGLVAALARDQAAGLVSSRQLYMAQPGLVHNDGADLHYSGLVFLRNVLRSAAACDSEVTRVQSVVGASLAVRRTVWDELGGFRPQFFMYYEEMDLSWRAELAGYTSLCVPQSVVLHEVPRGRVSDRKLHHICRNRLLSVLTLYRWPTLVLLLPGLLLAELAEFGYVAVAGRWRGIRAKLAAYSWLIRNMRGVALLRRRSQPLRRVPDWAVLENRAWALDPREFTGGVAGRLLAWVASIPLHANGWLAWRVCRLLGW